MELQAERSVRSGRPAEPWRQRVRGSFGVLRERRVAVKSWRGYTGKEKQNKVRCQKLSQTGEE